MIILSSSLNAGGCPGFTLPLSSSVVRAFAPIGRWAGHWGIDFAVVEGSTVVAVGDGVVRFAGTVVSNRSVSIDHGGGLVTSYSYLAETSVSRGDPISRGDAVGLSGLHGGTSAFHLSLRIQGRYVDPLTLRECDRGPSRGLYLAVGGSTYAVGRARDPRRHFRPAPQRSHRNGQSREYPVGARRRASDASARSVAET